MIRSSWILHWYRSLDSSTEAKPTEKRLAGYTSKMLHYVSPILDIQLVVINFQLRFVIAENHMVKVPNAWATGQHWSSDIATNLLPG